MKITMSRLILLFILYALGACFAQQELFEQETLTSEAADGGEEAVDIGFIDYGFDSIDFWDRSHWENGREEDKMPFQELIPTMESFARQAAQMVSDAYSRKVPVQPSQETIKKINSYFNPDMSSAGEEGFEVDAFGNINAAEARAKNQRELLTDMFKFDKVEDESYHGRRAISSISLPSVPANHTLGPTCATKYCEILQTVLSCKAFQIHMSKICAKYFVGLIFSCPNFPDKYHLQYAPVSCQVEFANAAANLQSLSSNLAESSIFKYAFSDFHTNCKRRCYQKYQSQTMDFFYGSECRAQVQTVINHPYTIELHPTAVPTKNPTASPTPAADKPTVDPTVSPTANPSASPTTRPTAKPTLSPSAKPSARPTPSPTNANHIPTAFPTLYPSARPTTSPTLSPTIAPSYNPPHVNKYPVLYLMWNFRMFRNQACTSDYFSSPAPTADPTFAPSNPTVVPTSSPTPIPTATPTAAPSLTASPTSLIPTADPTFSPTANPSTAPTSYAPSPKPTLMPSYWNIPTHKPTPIPTASPTTAAPSPIAEEFEDNCWMKVSQTLSGLIGSASSGGGATLPYDCFATSPFGAYQPLILDGLYKKAFKGIGCCYGTIIQLIQQSQKDPAVPPFLLPPCILKYMKYQGITGVPYPPSGIPLVPTNVCPLGANANLSITEFTIKVIKPIKKGVTKNILNYISVFNSTGNLALVTAINAALINTGLACCKNPLLQACCVNLVDFPYYFPNYTKAYSTNVGIFNYQYYSSTNNAAEFPGGIVPANVYQLVNSSASASFNVTLGFQGNISSSYLSTIIAVIQSPAFNQILAQTIPQVIKTFYPQDFPSFASLQAIGSPSCFAQTQALTQYTSAALPTTPNSSAFSIISHQSWQFVLFCLLSVCTFLLKFY